MIYVTHDQVEAMTLADKIVVLKDGRIMQVGTPRELYEKPDNLFVAQFIGSPKMNVLPCGRNDSGVELPGSGHVTMALAEDVNPSRLGIRPEHITVANPGEGNIDGKVEVAEYLGADTFLYISAEGADTMIVRVSGQDQVKEGSTVGLQFQDDKVQIFDENKAAIH